MAAGAADGTAVDTDVGDSTQTSLAHANDEQSSPSVHAKPTLQGGHAPPPQSTSVSEASATPFVQVSNVGMGVGTVVGGGVGAAVGASVGMNVLTEIDST